MTREGEAFEAELVRHCVEVTHPGFDGDVVDLPAREAKPPAVEADDPAALRQRSKKSALRELPFELDVAHQVAAARTAARPRRRSRRR
jgi:hypothetical protein